MKIKTRAEFLVYLSAIFLFSHVCRVKSVRIINVDRVLPFHSNDQSNFNKIKGIHGEDIHHFKTFIENNPKQLQQWPNSLSFPLKKDHRQYKKIETKLPNKKDIIPNGSPPFPNDNIDRTFQIFGLGDTFSQVLKQNEEIVKNVL